MTFKNKLFKKIRNFALILLILLSVLAIVFRIYSLNYYHADQNTINSITRQGGVTISRLDNDTLAFIPSGIKTSIGIIFYPGGKVEYTAYEAFMYEIAQKGILCILPRMPENLAFLAVDKADGLADFFPDIHSWYLAGHSLGGVAAGEYLKNNYDKFKGLILCASYTTSDLSDTGLKILSIYGSHDNILNMDNYKKSLPNLGTNYCEKIIEGGCHSYFGSYSLQNGDGNPTITNEKQMKEAATIISEWINN